VGVVDIPNNWWGSHLAPGLNDVGAATSDPITANATTTTWIHDDGYWAERNFALTWYGSTTYTAELATSVNTWNNKMVGAGLIPVATASSATAANFIISDYSDSSTSTTSGKDVCGFTPMYFISENHQDQMKFNNYCMDVTLAKRNSISMILSRRSLSSAQQASLCEGSSTSVIFL
jgi:hypothetical protein